jgi:hypothetical protein
MSTLSRIVLGLKNKKFTILSNSDWTNFLFEVVNDAIDGYEWNTFERALSILAFYLAWEEDEEEDERLRTLLAKYKEFVFQQTDKEMQAYRNLYDEIKTGGGQTEMFDSIINVVTEKINIAINGVDKLDSRVADLTKDIISFMQVKQTISVFD